MASGLSSDTIRLMKNWIFVVLFMLLSGCRFYEVDHLKLVRGPQPTPEQLEEAILKYKLKTVINLRGAKPGEGWYDQEKEVADRHSVDLISIGMSASHIPHRKNLIALLEVFKNAVRPILVHCLAGVDRTGEAAALYQMIYMGKSKDQALEMLSPQFGHFENVMPSKRYFVRDVWRGEKWAYEEYDPCDGSYQYYDTKSAACSGGTVPAPSEDDDT